MQREPGADLKVVTASGHLPLVNASPCARGGHVYWLVASKQRERGEDLKVVTAAGINARRPAVNLLSPVELVNLRFSAEWRRQFRRWG